MRKIYTQFLSRTLAIALGVLGVTGLSAQYTIQTASDDTFGLQIADIGQFEGDKIDGTIVVIDDICAGVTGVDGAIVVADIAWTIEVNADGNNYVAYTNCEASNVVEAAEAGGAVAVIFCNTDPDANVIAHNYERTPESSSAISGFDITKPAFSTTIASCDELKVQVGSVASLELLVPDCNRMIPENVVWGANGEGEFDGGLNGWTVDNDNGFKWEALGKLDRGAYNNFSNQIQSPTLCNGAVIVDSSFGDNGGVPGRFETGECPTDGQNIFCESSLTSPIIDLSGVTEGVFMQFNQAVRQFDSEYSYQVSIDGGATFAAAVPLNGDLELNSDNIDEVVRVPLLNAQGNAEVVVRFNYTGNYYYWAIDDVFVVTASISDVRVNSNFMAQAPNYSTPSSQKDIIALLADIENVGNDAANGVTLTATLTNTDDNSLVFMENFDYGTIAPGFIDQNRLFDARPDLPSEIGSYRLTYGLNSLNDDNGDNDNQSLNFVISENRFAKCTEASATASIAVPDVGFQTLGNAYYVSDATNAAGEQLYFGNAVVGIDDNDITGTVGISLYQWIDADNDGFIPANDGTGAPERFTIATANQLIFAGIENNRIEVAIRDEDGERIPVEANTMYLLVSHSIPNTATEQFRFMAADNSASNDFNFAATGFAFGAGSADGFVYNNAGEQQFDDNGNALLVAITDNPINMTRVGTMAGTGASGDEDTRQLGSISNFTVLADIFLETLTGTEDINESIGVEVFPNPAANHVFVGLELENVSKNVNLQVVDVAGKIVMSQNFANVKNDKLQLDIADLNAGIFVVNIRTEEGFTSTRFIKN